MPGKGFAPAPTAVKLAKGERRPSRVNYDEPDLPQAENLDPPEGLTGVGLEEWQAQIRVLTERGVLTGSDLRGFEDYCRALTELRRHEAVANAAEPELAIAKGYLNAVVKLRAQVNSLRQQCGLTPASRTGVKAAKSAPVKGTSPAERYLQALSGGRSGAA